VGAVLARDKGATVWHAHRVIVHRGQARSYGSPKPVGARLARDKGAAVWQAYRVIVHRGQARSYGSPKPVGARLARDKGATVWQAYRVIVHRGQARSYGSPKPVGARLARELGGAVWQAYRVIVHRGQATLPQATVDFVGASGRHPDLPANWALRSGRYTASSFIAGKRAPTDHQNLLERGLPAIRAPRSGMRTA